MRKIKFRAWDKEHKVMLSKKCNEDLFYEIEKSDGSLKDWVILMQFTGIKDKNGKEIYEGDIVKCKDQVGESIIRILKVEFREGCFCLDDEYMNPETQLWKYEDVEIIGNIYKNPELFLTKEEKKLNKQLMKIRHNNMHTIMATQKVIKNEKRMVW